MSAHKLGCTTQPRNLVTPLTATRQGRACLQAVGAAKKGVEQLQAATCQFPQPSRRPPKDQVGHVMSQRALQAAPGQGGSCLWCRGQERIWGSFKKPGHVRRLQVGVPDQTMKWFNARDRKHMGAYDPLVRCWLSRLFVPACSVAGLRCKVLERPCMQLCAVLLSKACTPGGWLFMAARAPTLSLCDPDAGMRCWLHQRARSTHIQIRSRSTVLSLRAG